MILVVAGVIIVLKHPSSRGGESMLVDKRFTDLVSGVPQGISVRVNAIGDDGWFYREYTCDGPDKTPTVHISGIPDNAKAIALIMYDPDAPIGTFIHWLAVKDASDREATMPATGMIEGRNDFRYTCYGGPCPPHGHGAHRYFFLVLALDEKPNVGRGFTLNQLLSSVKGHVVSWGYTMGRYER